MKIVLVLIGMVMIAFGAQTIKIAEYNVENLFDLHFDGHEYKEYIPNTHANWNQKSYRIKLDHTARVIADIDADIIALVEIESLQALKDLRKALQRKGKYYKYYAIADQKNTTVKVAVLSKLPFVYKKEIWVNRSYSQRNILELKYKVDKEEFYLFVNHWKSKRSPESKRIESAKALKKRLKTIGYDKNIIITGDFNSDFEEYKKFTRKRKLNDTDGKTGINHVLETIKYTQKANKVVLDSHSLYNLWYDVEPSKRWNYIHKGEKETLDSMIVSASVLKRGSFEYIYGSFHTFKKPYLFYKNRINRWYMRYSNKGARHMGKGYSDHLPILASFRIK